MPMSSVCRPRLWCPGCARNGPFQAWATLLPFCAAGVLMEMPLPPILPSHLVVVGFNLRGRQGRGRCGDAAASWALTSTVATSPESATFEQHPMQTNLQIWGFVGRAGSPIPFGLASFSGVGWFYVEQSVVKSPSVSCLYPSARLTNSCFPLFPLAAPELL